ncbi:winged helix-turn-helix domain-containing protein [Defluviimonas sp. SAOS-178_SWC]|uniref:winged helix-turn-helix domain-containing protein n=1 Tax=Defluviimonas sp. SAOS-178_SWC TaxID=3121287 RepID=UPI0032220F34
MSLPLLGNAEARRLFLDRHALIEPPSGPAKGDDLLALIRRLGFVQVDSINTVERAHHMILWSRRQGYRPGNLARLLERDRTLFEHWTHDASVIPTEFFDHWKLRFARDAERIHTRWADWQGSEFHAKVEDVLAHIRTGGPCGSGDVGTDETRGKDGWWEWHPSKTALEYLWRSGALSVCHRRNFAKVYDLTERVHPDAHAASAPAEAETIVWACNAALDRLGFATSGEIASFWDTVTPQEAKDWCAGALKRGEIIEIAVEGADGRLRNCFARPDVTDAAAAVGEAPNRVRILSPFDPALRDRNRAERIFGFFYRIEVFVPEAKRQYGYYVFPVMERDRIIGRLDAKAVRAEGRLAVRAFWPEPGVAMGAGRIARLMAELDRLARFAGCDRVSLADGWLRTA